MKKFISEATTYSFSLMVALVIAYLLHFLATRFLGVQGYALFSKYFGILLFLTIPTTTIQSFVAREVAKGKNCTGYVMKKLIIFLLPISIILLFLGEGYSPISLFILLYLLSIYRGVLQGEFRKKELSFNIIIEPIVRILFFIFFIKLGLGYIGALLAFGIGYLFAFLPGVRMKYHNEKIDLKPIISFVFASIIIFYPTSMTLFLSSFSLSSQSLSAFGVVILLSKVILFLSLAIGMAYLPRAVRGEKNLITSILILIFFSIPLILLPNLFTYFFPKFYSGYIIKYLPIASISMLLMGTSYILINHYWSKREDWVILLPGVIYIIIQTIFSFGKNLDVQVYGMLVSSVVLLSSLLISKGFLIFRHSSS